MGIRASAAVVMGGVFLLAGMTGAPAMAAPQIDVAPSPNGLVMLGVPTSITASGFSGRARILRYDDRTGTWLYMGVTTAGRPLTYVFPKPGRTTIKVVPKSQKARSIVVPVYGRFVTTTDPTTFGDVQLPNGRPVSAFDPPWTVPASAGCARVDVGLQAIAQPGSTATGTLLVQSSGEPDARLTVTDGGSVMLGVPVKGDVAISVIDWVNPNDMASKAGVVWYCAGQPKLVQIPS